MKWRAAEEVSQCFVLQFDRENPLDPFFFPSNASVVTRIKDGPLNFAAFIVHGVSYYWGIEPADNLKGASSLLDVVPGRLFIPGWALHFHPITGLQICKRRLRYGICYAVGFRIVQWETALVD